jgi:UDP-N-acetylglucosamine acyltransferase
MAGADVHPTAIVADGAELGDDVVIGPYCTVGPHVRLADGVRLISHVVVDGRTVIGARSEVYPFAAIGLRPQDLKYRGEPSTLTVGEDTVIREHVTMNTGTEGGGMETRVGDRCLFMVGSHVAHDCHVGDDVILANNATMAGHVTVGDGARLGGLSAIHQFVRIGEHAMIGGMTGVDQDVIPFGLVVGERGHLAGLNLVGLRRQGFDREEIHGLRSAYRLLFVGDGEMSDRVRRAEDRFGHCRTVQRLLGFLGSDSDRKVLKPRAGGEPGDGVG